MFRETTKIIKRSKKEVIYKIITSLFIQGLALIIPVFWSNTINEVTDGNYKIGCYYNCASFFFLLYLVLFKSKSLVYIL